MKRIFLLSILFLAGFAGNAMAQACLGTRQTAAQITSKFNDKLLCASRPTAGSNLDRWAEEHAATSVNVNGGLVEHAKGSNDPVDPRHSVGTWAALTAGCATPDCVKYDYGTGGVYFWSVWEQTAGIAPGAPLLIYNFCSPDGQTKIASGTLQILPSASEPNPCGY